MIVQTVIATDLITPLGAYLRLREAGSASFLLESGQPVEIGIDGEALVLDPPIRFRTLPGALRVRIPLGAPGYSPAAAAPPTGWAAVTALLQTAAGRPVAIES
jgi:hypothetical protein